MLTQVNTLSFFPPLFDFTHILSQRLRGFNFETLARMWRLSPGLTWRGVQGLTHSLQVRTPAGRTGAAASLSQNSQEKKPVKSLGYTSTDNDWRVHIRAGHQIRPASINLGELIDHRLCVFVCMCVCVFGVPKGKHTHARTHSVTGCQRS